MTEEKHYHQWRYIRENSTTVTEYYNCNCGAFIRVFLDPDNGYPVIMEYDGIKNCPEYRQLPHP